MLKQSFIETDDNSSQPKSKKKGSGPPNRMNDLVYRDWMKFQKSFFRYTTDQNLVEENIYFFTKAIWPDGLPSKCLIIGFDNFDKNKIAEPRIVDCISAKSFDDIVNSLVKTREMDFIFIDLRWLITGEETLFTYIENYSEEMMQSLKLALKPLRYCCILTTMPDTNGGGFPIPWSVAAASRDYLRLRDEKIGLVDKKEQIYYCLFMQAEKDKRPGCKFIYSSINLTKIDLIIPGWIIPKPPPRKKNEVLHPAKFPETLISEFINLFTKQGEKVLDPMAGTGSTVISAIRTGRNGYGIDLMPEFVKISQDRIAEEQVPSLFDNLCSPAKGYVIQGDATKLSDIAELDGLIFDYVITSPPYWSMLTNPGSENQEKRRKQNLRLAYSENPNDLGNIQNYDKFLKLLVNVYCEVETKLKPGGYLTVIVKNVKREHIVYPLAWDIVLKLCGKNGTYEYVGNTFWCQDDVGIKPFAVGIHWVSNTLHHYCLHFRKPSGRKLFHLGQSK
ncbi:MAG: site-specific DNA-methyltransferase [Anaerolineaceae bacterium]|jgi:DNA modification methylase